MRIDIEDTPHSVEFTLALGPFLRESDEFSGAATGPVYNEGSDYSSRCAQVVGESLKVSPLGHLTFRHDERPGPFASR